MNVLAVAPEGTSKVRPVIWSISACAAAMAALIADVCELSLLGIPKYVRTVAKSVYAISYFFFAGAFLAGAFFSAFLGSGLCTLLAACFSHNS